MNPVSGTWVDIKKERERMTRKLYRVETILRNNIRMLMRMYKINQTNFCKLAEVDIPNFNSFLNKKRGLSMKNLEKIASLIRLKPEKLYNPYLIQDPKIKRKHSLVI